jgi:5-methylcytosine-specific restriction protein A
VPEQGTKYSPLGTHLRSQAADELFLTLEEIGGLVGGLPEEATKHQFWANATNHHVSRRRQWLDAGYDAFLTRRSGSPGVVFRRRKDTGTERAWTQAELRACVVAYRRLLLAEQAGVPLNKSALRREVLQEDLSARTDGAYEFRMQNISAVLQELGLDQVKGYLPAKNVGRVKDEIVELINELWGRQQEFELPTDDEAALETSVLSARSKFARGKLVPPAGNKRVQRSNVASSRFLRDANVIAWVLETANGNCEVCDSQAPFLRPSGVEYLEVHHVRPLNEGGPDTIENACACCPNCHRRLHYGGDSLNLRRQIISKLSRLVDYPAIKINEAIDAEA